MNSGTHFFDLNSYTLEHILKYLEIEDIKNISMVNRYGYNLTKQWFENKSVLILPKVISSEVIDILKGSSRDYNYAIYKLRKITKGNILEPLEHLPFKNIVMTTFYWESVDEVNQSENFQVEVFSSQIKKAHKIRSHVTKINLNHKTLPILFDVFKTFHNLKQLHLSNLKDDGEFDEVEFFPKPQKLKTVKFSWGSFILTANLLNTFKGLTSLTFQSIDDIEFIKALIESNKTTLKHLCIEITPEISEISLFCQLHHLEVCSSKVNESLKNLLEQQRNLRSLILKSPLIDEFLIKFLENCTTLDSLTVTDPKSNEMDICRVNLPNVTTFIGNVQNFVPISKNLRILRTEIFNVNVNFDNLSELTLLRQPKFERQHYDFELFEDFKDHHMFEPLNPFFLRSLQTTTTLKLDWSISLNEYKKVVKELPNLEAFHFNISPQDLKEFESYFEFIEPHKQLKFVLFKIDIFSINEYSVAKEILKDSINELLLGDFFKPFTIFVDFHLKERKRNVIYFSGN